MIGEQVGQVFLTNGKQQMFQKDPVVLNPSITA